jgi:hypothetical protein
MLSKILRKILRAFDTADTQFLATLQDATQKTKYIKKLRYARFHSVLLLGIFIMLALCPAVFSDVEIPGLIVLIIVLEGFAYLDADNKLRVIHAIDLLQAPANPDEIIPAKEGVNNFLSVAERENSK